MNTFFIYGLIDPKTNELKYIGKSINPKVRLRKHISERNKHDSYKDRWIRKLINGGIKPELVILDEINDNWQYWEIFYILYFKSLGCKLTNGTIGGDEPPTTKGRKHTQISRQKMSDTKRGKPIPWLNNGLSRTDTHKNNLGNSHKGKVSEKKNKTYEEIYGYEKSLQLKKKLSDAHLGIQKGKNHPMYGKKHSEQTKINLSKKNNKSVYQFYIDGKFIKEWESIKIAQDCLKIKNISNACKGKYKSAGGFIWKYKE